MRVTRAGVNFADTHQRHNQYVAKQELPLIPGSEVAGVREDTGERVLALCGTGGYAEYATRARRAVLPDPRRGRGRHRARAARPGPDRVAPVPHGRRGCSRGETRRRALGGGRRRLARRPARQGDGRGPRDRHRGDARTSARWRWSSAPTPRSTARPRAWPTGCARPTTASRSTSSSRWPAARSSTQSLEALAPFGRLVVYGIASREQNEVPHGPAACAAATRVAGFWLWHCLDRPAMVDEALADLFARAERGELRAVVGDTYALSDARAGADRPRRAPHHAASCCWIRPT